jgi:lactosylceramide 4-alpha-galactosyltransferase
MLNGAVLIFDRWNSYIRDCIEDCFANFNGEVWGKQGPFLVTRVFRQGNYTAEVVRVQPRMAFYPYLPRDAVWCLRGPGSNATIQIDAPTIKGMVEHTYIIHTNNKKTKKKPPEPGSACECLRMAFCVVTNDCQPRCTLFDPSIPTLKINAGMSGFPKRKH